MTGIWTAAVATAVLSGVVATPVHGAVTVQAQYELGIVPHLRISGGSSSIVGTVNVTKSGNAEFTGEPYTIDANFFTTISDNDYSDSSGAGITIRGIAEFVNTTTRKVTAGISFTQDIQKISFTQTNDPTWQKRYTSYFAFSTIGFLNIDYYPSDKSSRTVERYNHNSASLPIVFTTFNVDPGDTARVEFFAELYGFVHSSVPEPQSWTLLIAGFLLVGTAMRKARSVGEVDLPIFA